MLNDPIPDDVLNLWQNQACDSVTVPLAELRAQAGRFRTRVFRRNLREYLVAALVSIFFAYHAWTSPIPLMRAGNALMVAGLAYMVYQLHKRTSVERMPAEFALQTCLGFYRGELERQRDALRGVWRWYLGPMVPGLTCIVAAGGVANFQRSPLAGLLTLLYAGFAALMLWWLGRLNQNAARKLQSQIDALNTAEKESQ